MFLFSFPLVWFTLLAFVSANTPEKLRIENFQILEITGKYTEDHVNAIKDSFETMDKYWTSVYITKIKFVIKRMPPDQAGTVMNTATDRANNEHTDTIYTTAMYQKIYEELEDDGDANHNMEIAINKNLIGHLGTDPQENQKKAHDFIEALLHEYQHGFLGILRLKWDFEDKAVYFRKGPSTRFEKMLAFKTTKWDYCPLAMNRTIIQSLDKR